MPCREQRPADPGSVTSMGDEMTDKELALAYASDTTSVLAGLRAVAAAARREAMEEAAKLVDDLVLDHPGRADLTAIQCAAAIRARAEEPL